MLQDRDRSVRLTVLRQMQREQVPARFETLAAWLADEGDAAAVATLLEAVRSESPEKVRPVLTPLIADKRQTEVNRARALDLLCREPSATVGGDILLPLLADEAALIRSAAAVAAGRLQLRAASDQLLKLAADSDAQVRRSSLVALTRAGGRVYSRASHRQIAWANGLATTFDWEDLEAAAGIVRQLATVVAVKAGTA